VLEVGLSGLGDVKKRVFTGAEKLVVQEDVEDNLRQKRGAMHLANLWRTRLLEPDVTPRRGKTTTKRSAMHLVNVADSVDWRHLRFLYGLDRLDVPWANDRDRTAWTQWPVPWQTSE
jgi:hypothetical protein